MSGIVRMFFESPATGSRLIQFSRRTPSVGGLQQRNASHSSLYESHKDRGKNGNSLKQIPKAWGRPMKISALDSITTPIIPMENTIAKEKSNLAPLAKSAWGREPSRADPVIEKKTRAQNERNAELLYRQNMLSIEDLNSDIRYASSAMNPSATSQEENQDVFGATTAKLVLNKENKSDPREEIFEEHMEDMENLVLEQHSHSLTPANDVQTELLTQMFIEKVKNDDKKEFNQLLGEETNAYQSESAIAESTQSMKPELSIEPDSIISELSKQLQDLKDKGNFLKAIQEIESDKSEETTAADTVNIIKPETTIKPTINMSDIFKQLEYLKQQSDSLKTVLSERVESDGRTNWKSIVFPKKTITIFSFTDGRGKLCFPIKIDETDDASLKLADAKTLVSKIAPGSSLGNTGVRGISSSNNKTCGLAAPIKCTLGTSGDSPGNDNNCMKLFGGVVVGAGLSILFCQLKGEDPKTGKGCGLAPESPLKSEPKKPCKVCSEKSLPTTPIPLNKPADKLSEGEEPTKDGSPGTGEPNAEENKDNEMWKMYTVEVQDAEEEKPASKKTPDQPDEGSGGDQGGPSDPPPPEKPAEPVDETGPETEPASEESPSKLDMKIEDPQEFGNSEVAIKLPEHDGTLKNVMSFVGGVGMGLGATLVFLVRN